MKSWKKPMILTLTKVELTNNIKVAARSSCMIGVLR